MRNYFLKLLGVLSIALAITLAAPLRAAAQQKSTVYVEIVGMARPTGSAILAEHNGRIHQDITVGQIGGGRVAESDSAAAGWS